MKINNELKNILINISASGGVGLLVGGSVRDWLTDPAIIPKDLDVEVYGMDIENLIKILGTYGKVDVVGRSFGVIKVTTEQTDYDFSLPRRENKTGQGHKGFIVEPDPTMTTREAAARRDFTFNALAYNPLTGELIDHFDGKSDLKNGVMSATSEAFSEDPLRVLRGFQFAGRYGFRADARTLDMCARALFPSTLLSRSKECGVNGTSGLQSPLNQARAWNFSSKADGWSCTPNYPLCLAFPKMLNGILKGTYGYTRCMWSMQRRIFVSAKN
jgi:tRNA nucleotidyltransferase (CCA-adding enzyme)